MTWLLDYIDGVHNQKGMKPIKVILFQDYIRGVIKSRILKKCFQSELKVGSNNYVVWDGLKRIRFEMAVVGNGIRICGHTETDKYGRKAGKLN